MLIAFIIRDNIDFKAFCKFHKVFYALYIRNSEIFYFNRKKEMKWINVS